MLLATSVALTVRRRGGGTNLAVQAFRMVWGASNGGGLGTMTAYGETFGRYGSLGTLPGSTVNYASEVGDPAHNAVVSIGLNWIANQFSEPQFQVTRRRRDGSEEPVAGHPVTRLIERPNTEYDGFTLWAATAKDRKTAGNAYWVKARGAGGSGQPLQLWHVPHWEIVPRWPADGSEFITDYLYRPGGRGAGISIARENVIHFRSDLNPYNGGRTARQPLYPLLREIYQDNESAEYEAAITANMGVPGGMLSPKDAEGEIPQDARDSLVSLWADKFTGSGRGAVLVPSHALEYTKIGQSPAELGIADLRDRPEDRICAALGISPMVLGLTSGASQKTYANYLEARKAAYDDCILPLLAEFARVLTYQLLPDFSPGPTERCGWNLDNVKALSEDKTEIYNRVNSAVTAGWMTVDQARRLAGVKTDDDAYEETCKVFLVPTKATAVADLAEHAEQAHEAAEPPDVEAAEDTGEPMDGEESDDAESAG